MYIESMRGTRTSSDRQRSMTDHFHTCKIQHFIHRHGDSRTISLPILALMTILGRSSPPMLCVVCREYMQNSMCRSLKAFRTYLASHFVSYVSCGNLEDLSTSTTDSSSRAWKIRHDSLSNG